VLGTHPFVKPTKPQHLDAISNEDRVLVLPRSHDNPAGLPERRFVTPITSNVRVELGSPPFSVRLGSHRLLRATMPKTAVHEHSDSCPSQRDIWTARKVSHVHPIPEPSTVQLTSQGQLRTRPGSPKPDLKRRTAGLDAWGFPEPLNADGIGR